MRGKITVLHRTVTYENQTLQTLSDQFRRFAERECRDSASTFYERLSLGVAEDNAILQLALGTKRGQPAPNIFFAAVQFMLLRGYEHPLAKFYPGITQSPDSVNDPMPHLRAFCEQYGTELWDIISKRIVQTNEVRRCASFLPALFLVANRVQSQPFHFVDVGASAGLHLLWDRYCYTYTEQGTYGDMNAPVQIWCESRGNKVLPLSQSFPQTASRIGVDLQPVDIKNAEDVIWLRSLIFPNHEERIKLFTQAIETAQKDPPQMIAGDAVQVLPQLLSSYNDNLAICLLFSFSSYQMFSQGRDSLRKFLMELSNGRAVFEVSIGNFGNKIPQIILAEYQGGQGEEQTVGTCHLHGNWIEWKADEYR